jgi:hypothetical protein
MIDSQSKGIAILAALTVWNMAMASVMLAGLHVVIGMPIAFVGMGIICYVGMTWLMGKERPWK